MGEYGPMTERTYMVIVDVELKNNSQNEYACGNIFLFNNGIYIMKTILIFNMADTMFLLKKNNFNRNLTSIKEIAGLN